MREINVRGRHSRTRIQHPGGGESKTQVPTGLNVDINILMRRMSDSGERPIGDRELTFGDFTNVNSLQDAISIVEANNEQFAQLPALVRDAAANNPVRLVEMYDDPDGYEALVDAEYAAAGRERPAPPPEPAQGTPEPQETPSPGGESEG